MQDISFLVNVKEEGLVRAILHEAKYYIKIQR